MDGWLFNIDFILIYEMFRNIMDILMDVFFLYEFVVGMNGQLVIFCGFLLMEFVCSVFFDGFMLNINIDNS